MKTDNIGEALTVLRVGGHHHAAQSAAKEIGEMLEEIARLRAALKPFADLSGIYVRRAETFGWKDGDGVFGAADAQKEQNITVGDCRAALKALGE